MPRSPADLRAAARNPSFTPSVAEVPALVALAVAEDDDVELARVLGRQPEAAAAAARKALDGAVAPVRARLVRLLDRLGAAAPAALFIGLAGDADPKASRVALVALGKRPGAEAEKALAAAIQAPRSAAHLRAAVEALGKIGTAAARDTLGTLARGDAELDRVAARARLRVERGLGRDAPSKIDPHATVRAPIELHCRGGLERLLSDELGAGWRPAGPGRVRGVWNGRLGDVFRARLFIDFGFVVSVAKQDVAAALAGALPLLRATTKGALRYRLAFAAGGHRRAEVQSVAAEIAARVPELVNDPTASTWEVHVDQGELLLVPRRLDDPRFAYRVRDLPAASHPTLAAALARVAGVHSDDIVWDPFCGSGSELVERARLGPARALVGSDRDPVALAAARTNLAAAGVRADLRQRDVFESAPEGVTLVVTNPPMGRRMARPDLGRFVDHIAAALAPGGRLAWISPVPRQSRDQAQRGGLHLAYAQTVEMGGFSAEIQVFAKPTSPRNPSTSARRRSRA